MYNLLNSNIYRYYCKHFPLNILNWLHKINKFLLGILCMEQDNRINTKLINWCYDHIIINTINFLLSSQQLSFTTLVGHLDQHEHQDMSNQFYLILMKHQLQLKVINFRQNLYFYNFFQFQVFYFISYQHIQFRKKVLNLQHQMSNYQMLIFIMII